MAATEFAGPAIRSPQQRRLAALTDSDGAQWYHTTCRVAIPPTLDPARLSATATPIVERLCAETGTPAGHEQLTCDGDTLTLSLPAACADEYTILAVLNEVLALSDEPRPDALPYSAAAQWWDELTKSPSAGVIREFWRARAVGWQEPLPAAFHCPTADRGFGEVALSVPSSPEDSAARLLAAWQVLLRRHSGQARHVIAVATDLRRHADLRICRGPLTAYLPVPADTSLDASLAEHTTAMAQHLAEGAQRAEWFDWDRVLPDKSASTRALPFGFRYTELPAAHGDTEILDLDSRSDRFALRLICQRTAVDMRLRLEYDRSLVSAELAEDLLAELAGLSAADQDRPAADIPLCTREIHDRLTDWGTGPSTRLPAGGLPALIRATAAQHPHAIAARDLSLELTYEELVAEVDSLAGVLRDRGVRPGDCVGVDFLPGVGLLVGFLGILASGGAYVYLDPALPAGRLSTMAKDVRVMVTADMLASTTATKALTAIESEALAYVIHTSGSTGTPKGVQVTHDGLVNYLLAIADDWPRGGDSLVSTSVAFDITLPALYVPLLSGGSVCFTGELTDHSYAVARATPSHLRMLLAEGDAARLRCDQIAVGGEPLPAALAEQWAQQAPNTRLLNYYGPTETVGARVRGHVDPAEAGPTGTIPIGAPIANTTLRVLDTNLRLCPLGAQGELYIGGTGLSRGYAGKPAATAERFVPDPSGSPGSRLYRTGDLTRWLPGGRLEFVGRSDDQAKIRGYRVEPAEVAAVLSSHPDVHEAVVIHNDGLVAYLVAKGEPVPTARLRDHAAEVLPEHMLPSAVVWLDELPVGPNGKLDRSALPAPSTQQSERTGYQPPRNHTEQVLAEVWAEVLKVDRVGVNDSFYEIGGDSILSILVAARAAKRGLKLSLRHFFAYQTIAAMAPFVEHTGAAREVSGRGLTPVQCWFFGQDMPHRGHWNQGWLLELDEAPDTDALARAIDAVRRHHPALRSRFLPDPDAPGGWRPDRGHQSSAAGDPGASGFRRIPIAEQDWPDGVTTAVAGLQEIDIATGPPLRIALLDGGPGRRRLAFVAHHLVVDTVSWQLIFDDLRTAYQQVRAGIPVDLPAGGLPPDEWGAALAGAVDQAAKDIDFWLAQSPAELPALPVDHDAAPARVADQREVEVVLDPARTATLLRKVSGAVRVDQVLTTAVALAVASWTGQPHAHLLVEGQGRDQDLVRGVDVYRSVGWFTTLAPLLIPLNDESPMDALRAVRQRFAAMPTDGLTYGVLRHLDPVRGPQLAALPQPQISVNYVGNTGGEAPRSAGELDMRPAPERMPTLLHPTAPRTRLWVVNAVVRDDQLRITTDYSASHYEPQTARDLAEDILSRLTQLIDAWTETGTSRSDNSFPLVGADVASAMAQAIARAPRRPVLP